MLRRKDGSVNFDREWENYKFGFGSLERVGRYFKIVIYFLFIIVQWYICFLKDPAMSYCVESNNNMGYNCTRKQEYIQDDISFKTNANKWSI